MSEGREDIRLFVVHAREDRDKARQVRRWLSHHPGVRLATDEDVGFHPGQSPWEAMRDQIEKSDIVFFLATPQSLEAESTLLELGMTWGMEKPIIWVQVGRVPLQSPVELRKDHAVAYEDIQDPEVVDDLLRRYREPASA
jgi:hypothetical protein